MALTAVPLVSAFSFGGRNGGTCSFVGRSVFAKSGNQHHRVLTMPQHRRAVSTTAPTMLLGNLFGGAFEKQQIPYDTLDHPGPELAAAAQAGIVPVVSPRNWPISVFLASSTPPWAIRRVRSSSRPTARSAPDPLVTQRPSWCITIPTFAPMNNCWIRSFNGSILPRSMDKAMTLAHSIVRARTFTRPNKRPRYRGEWTRRSVKSTRASALRHRSWRRNHFGRRNSIISSTLPREGEGAIRKMPLKEPRTLFGAMDSSSFWVG
jgi:hypothetical protein